MDNINNVSENQPTQAENPQSAEPKNRASGSGSLLKNLSPAHLLILSIVVILLIAVIIFLIVVLSGSTNQSPTPTTDQTAPSSDQSKKAPPAKTQKPRPKIKITSYVGAIKSIKGATVQIEVLPDKNPGITESQGITINVTKQTVLIQRSRPTEIPKGMDPAKLIKQRNITIRDLQIGDEIIASAGGEDLFGKTEFTAQSIMKIIITD